MELYRAPSGDTARRKGNGIIVRFNGKRSLLATSAFHGGYRKDCTAIFNYDGTCGMPKRYRMLADTYEEHMRLVSERLGLDPTQVVGMDTAAQMDNVAIVERTYRTLTVTAIVTAGIEENGGRAGDVADYYEPDYTAHYHGTINIMLLIDGNLGEATLARALVTATEAKTAAIQELLAASCYSEGLATGSGTDQTIIVSNRESSLVFTDAGKHSKLGELIGRAVIEAVKCALEKQTGLNRDKQMSVMRRLGRFGCTYEAVCKELGAVLSSAQEARLRRLDRDSRFVVDASLVAHLCDQYRWGLLSRDEARDAIERIVHTSARDFAAPAPVVEDACADSLIRVMIAVIMKEK